MLKNRNNLGALVIGGGFYGLRIALYLKENLGVNNIAILEKSTTAMSRASYTNQARVHNGYHYPRSILTGYRSAANFPRFVDEYSEAIVNDFDKYYAIARTLSKINSKQFCQFCKKIGVSAAEASENVRSLFNKRLIEETYLVKEYAFNSDIVRDILIERLSSYDDISIIYDTEVISVSKLKDATGVNVASTKGNFTASKVFNCTYAQINHLHRKSNLPLVGLKHEIVEMCLVKLPENLKDFSVTVMDGPFFSIMPFPSRGLHTLSHVRYTPHTSWIDDDGASHEKQNPYAYFDKYKDDSAYKKMYTDVIRYIPALKSMEYVDSITEVKTVLVKSEDDDSRPILFKSNFGFEGYNCIMGGKLDNIYDVFVELDELYAKKD